MALSRGGALTGQAAATGHDHLLDDLDDVATAGATAGDVLTYTGAGWIPAKAGDPTELAPQDAVLPGFTWNEFAVTAADVPFTVELADTPLPGSTVVFVNGIRLADAEWSWVDGTFSVVSSVFDGLVAPDEWLLGVGYATAPAAATEVATLESWSLSGAAVFADGGVSLTPAAAVSGSAVCPDDIAAPASITVTATIDGGTTAGGWGFALLDGRYAGTPYLGDDGWGVASPYATWTAVILDADSGTVWRQDLTYTDTAEPLTWPTLPTQVVVAWTRSAGDLGALSVAVNAVVVYEVASVWMPETALVAIGAWNPAGTVFDTHEVSDVSVVWS